MASRAKKITFGIIGSVLGLVLLAAVGLFAWIQFRPLLKGDYSHTYGYLRTVNELNSMALGPMVTSVGMPTSADAADKLTNRITNTQGQIDVLLEEVDGALESRAGQEDEELRRSLDELRSSYDGLKSTFAQWDDDGYADIGAAAAACVKDRSACTAAATSIEGAEPRTEPLKVLQEATIGAAESGTTSELKTAVTNLADEVDALWDPIETQSGDITSYLSDRGVTID